MYTGKISIENKIIDSEHYFKIVYCPEIKEHMLCVYIAWVAGYDRYYKIDEGDLSLYETNRSEFYAKYEKEINAKITERMMGSAALRDYDPNYLPDEVLKALDGYPPFDGYVYKDGILYARVKIGDTFFSIPPIKGEKL